MLMQLQQHLQVQAVPACAEWKQWQCSKEQQSDLQLFALAILLVVPLLLPLLLVNMKGVQLLVLLLLLAKAEQNKHCHMHSQPNGEPVAQYNSLSHCSCAMLVLT
jgi:hypothetical protein